MNKDKNFHFYFDAFPYMERNTDRKPDSLYLNIFMEILQRMTWSIIKITNAGYSSYCGVVAVEKTVVRGMGTNKKIEAGKCEVLLSANHYQITPDF